MTDTGLVLLTTTQLVDLIVQRERDDLAPVRDAEARKQEVVRLQAERTDLEEELGGLRATRTKKATLMDEATKEGLNAAAMRPALDDLDQQILDKANELDDALRRLDDATAQAKRPVYHRPIDFSAIKAAAAQLRDNYPDGLVAHVDEPWDCIGAMTVQFLETFDDGRPSVALGSMGPLRVRVTIQNAAGQFVPQVLPPSLTWLLKLEPDEPPVEPVADVVALLVSVPPEAQWQHVAGVRIMPIQEFAELLSTELGFKERTHSEDRDVVRATHQVDSLDLGLAYEVAAEPAHAEDWRCAGDPTPSRPYESPEEQRREKWRREQEELRRKRSPFLRALQHRVLQYTTTEPPFVPEPPVGSKELATRLQPHIDALKNCHWSGKVVGSLARLKHLLEGGAKPSYWVGPMPNSYGFRLRTRDHDWLLGDIVVVAEANGEPESRDLVVVDLPARHNQRELGARLGRMRIRVVASNW